MKLKQFQVIRNEWDFPLFKEDDYDVTQHDTIYALDDAGRLLVRRPGTMRLTNGWWLIPVPADMQPQLCYAN